MICDFTRDNYATYKKDDMLDYALCPIRGEISLPPYKPEEKIRLALLHFLHNQEIFSLSSLEIKVETERLDISIYNKGLGDLITYTPPAIIIETKRSEVELLSAFEQLSRYLTSVKTKCGILFNYVQGFCIEKRDGEYVSTELSNSQELLSFITLAIEQQCSELSQEIYAFNAAKNGDFYSFRQLATKYRRSKRVIFLLKQNDLEYTIEGHLFDFVDSEVFYVKCGLDTKAENKPSFTSDEFVRLLGIYRF
jgi:hypothetical protein